MKINLNNAVKFFFPNPSLEMVYFEAIANAIDAGATEIDVKINIETLYFYKNRKLFFKDDFLTLFFFTII